jgi:hypothetical protein
MAEAPGSDFEAIAAGIISRELKLIDPERVKMTWLDYISSYEAAQVALIDNVGWAVLAVIFVVWFERLRKWQK